MFWGLGGALGRVGDVAAIFRCLGGIDRNPAAICDFEGPAGVPGTVLDLFDLKQYSACHGHEPVASANVLGSQVTARLRI